MRFKTMWAISQELARMLWWSWSNAMSASGLVLWGLTRTVSPCTRVRGACDGRFTPAGLPAWLAADTTTYLSMRCHCVVRLQCFLSSAAKTTEKLTWHLHIHTQHVWAQSCPGSYGTDISSMITFPHANMWVQASPLLPGSLLTVWITLP